MTQRLDEVLRIFSPITSIIERVQGQSVGFLPVSGENVVKMKSFTAGNGGIVFGVTYQLVHAASDKVLDIYDSGTHNGANIQIFTNRKSENQLWVIHQNKDGTVKVINPKSGKALDVSGGCTSDGTNVQIFTDNGTNAQKWHLKEVGDGVFKLIHSSSGKALDVTGGRTADGTNVQIWSENDGVAQRWRLVRA
jgi:hypothetical protein